MSLGKDATGFQGRCRNEHRHIRAPANVLYGNIFVINSYGKGETRHLIVSLNYMVFNNADGNIVPPYGQIERGDLTRGTDKLWQNEDTKGIELVMSVAGGLGWFYGCGAGEGTLQAFSSSSETSATLVLGF